MTDALIDLYTVHCFLHMRGCEHTVRSTNPQDAHDRMEEHYATAHRAWLDSIFPEGS